MRPLPPQAGHTTVMILVTGGAGFIGANFVLDWLAHGREPVVNLDALTYAGYLQNLQPIAGDGRYRFVHGDIRDRDLVERLLAEHAVRAIVHFAAESHVDRSIHGPEEFVATNVVGTFRLLEAARAHWTRLAAADRDAFRSQGCDNHSVVGDPQFVNPASGDYRVGPDSPALAIGFVNFPMDQFGVQTPKLKAIARTPVLPNSTPNPPERRARRARTVSWLGATLADITGEGYSAFGIAEDDGGVHLAAVPTTSAAFRAGLRPDDVIQRVDGKAVKNLAAFRAADGKAEPGKPRTLAIVRGQQPQEVVIPPRRIKD